MTVPALQNLPGQAEGDTGVYVVFVLLHARSDRADDLQRRLTRQIEPTRAEPGCLEYHLARDRIDPDRFFFYEAYTDIAAFQAHLDMDYNRALLAELPPYLIEEPDVRFGIAQSAG